MIGSWNQYLDFSFFEVYHTENLSVSVCHHVLVCVCVCVCVCLCVWLMCTLYSNCTLYSYISCNIFTIYKLCFSIIWPRCFKMYTFCFSKTNQLKPHGQSQLQPPRVFKLQWWLELWIWYSLVLHRDHWTRISISSNCFITTLNSNKTRPNWKLEEPGSDIIRIYTRRFP